MGGGTEHRAADDPAPDGPGPAARFAWPEAVALDDQDQIYVADTRNHTIRRIDRNGDAVSLRRQFARMHGKRWQMADDDAPNSEASGWPHMCIIPIKSVE